jgi:hypothetical protein
MSRARVRRSSSSANAPPIARSASRRTTPWSTELKAYLADKAAEQQRKLDELEEALRGSENAA